MVKHLLDKLTPAVIMVLAGLTLVSLAVILVAADHAAAQDMEGDPVHGGQLYDDWMAVLRADAGEHEHHEHEEGAGEAMADQPLWATQSTNTLSGEDTWRCKECHGWDYRGVDGVYGSGSHYTGFPGIMSYAGQPVEDIVAVLQGSTNPDHDFSSVMDEHDLMDLAAFISSALIDDDTLLTADHASAGDASSGEALFGTVCVHCHGPQGNAINFESLDDPEFLAHIATDNPWEFIHKVRFGQAGWPMPSAIGNGWSEQDVADVLAYAETLTTEPALSGGGQLYDEWWAVLGVDAPETDQPLWATQNTNTLSGSDTWRCSVCHGWDFLGADGVNGSGPDYTGFPGVLDAASLSADELLGWLNGEANPDHDFSTVMDEAALNALVTFLQTEMRDITPYVNNDGTVNGDPRFGRDLFEGTCAACHGVDGRRINFEEDEGGVEYVGTVATENPWEFFHKGSFGQPGHPMPAGLALGWVDQDIADLLAYAQTLPAE